MPGPLMLPNTSIVATGSATLDTASSTNDAQLGTLTLPNNNTTVTLSDGHSISFAGIVSEGTGNVITNGTNAPISRDGNGWQRRCDQRQADYQSTLADLLNNFGGTPVPTALNSIGTGTLTLTASNTYSGATTVSNGGQLVLRPGSSISGSGNVTVNTGSQLTMGAGGFRRRQRDGHRRRFDHGCRGFHRRHCHAHRFHAGHRDNRHDHRRADLRRGDDQRRRRQLRGGLVGRFFDGRRGVELRLRW